MSLKTVLSEIDIKQNLNLSDDEKSSILYALRLAGLKDNTVEADVVSIVASQLKILRGGRTNPLTHKVKSALVIEECPICKGSMKGIVLGDGRKATYCTTHKVVMPIKEEKDSE